MDKELAIKYVEDFVPKDNLEQKAMEELLRYLKCEDKPSIQPVADAVVLGLKEVCEFLLLSGCDVDVIDTDLDGSWWSPLMFAVESAREDIFYLLLEHGADVNYCAIEQEQCPLEVAAENGRTDMFFELVRRGAKLDWEYYDEVIDYTFGYSKEELLSDAIFSRNERIARFLLEQGCDLDNQVLPGPESIREFAKRENALDFLEQVESQK